MLCTLQTTVQTVAQNRTQALDDNAWGTSQWLSARDAQVVTGQINDHENGRAADGASWFTTTDRTFTPAEVRYVRLFVVGPTQSAGNDAVRIYGFDLW